MTQMRFFTDEDIYGSAAAALRRSGFDAVSTPETERLGESDESQLLWATGEGRVTVTFNVAHFAALHSRWTDEGRHHAGIIVSIQRPIGELLRRIIHLATTLKANEMADRIEFLSDW